MATISGVYSCLHRTFTRCCMLFACPTFRHFRSLFSCWMMTLSHWLHWHWLSILSVWDCSDNVVISQLTLSLYLMTQCQLKLGNSVMSLAQTLDYIEVAQRRHPADRTLDHLTLKLIKRKVLTRLSVFWCNMLHDKVTDSTISWFCARVRPMYCTYCWLYTAVILVHFCLYCIALYYN